MVRRQCVTVRSTSQPSFPGGVVMRPKKNFPHCVQHPMLLPPAPPKEGTFRAFKGGRACASKRDFFLTHALQKKNRLLIANAEKNVKKNFGHLCYSCWIFDVVGERGVWVGICSR